MVLAYNLSSRTADNVETCKEIIYEHKNIYHPMVWIPMFIVCFWVFCHPFSKYCAEKHFETYMEEYNIPINDVETIAVIKPYTFSPTYIKVKYKKSRYTYYYYDDIGCIFFNEPHRVEIYNGSFPVSEVRYKLLNYPPVTRYKDYRTG